MDASKNLREEVPPKIVKWAKLEAINNAILNNFKNGEKLNADLINEFFEQPYFTWEESLINKLTETDNSITFDDIKKEWINLAILEFDDWLLDFKECIDKTSDAIQKAYIEEIHDRICIKLWWTPGVPPSLATPPTTGLYNDFDTECPLPTPPSSLNIVWYFNNVSKYLKNKEGSWWAKKTVNILKNITITNEDINNRLTIWDRLNSTIPLSHPSHNMDTKNSFDILTAFEIGKEADRTINIAKELLKRIDIRSCESDLYHSMMKEFRARVVIVTGSKKVSEWNINSIFIMTQYIRFYADYLVNVIHVARKLEIAKNA